MEEDKKIEKNLYYTAPSDLFFEEMKTACIEVWSGYGDTHGYASEKIRRIRDIVNVQDNFMFMLAMFDSENQKKVISKLSEGCKEALRDRMIAGGNDDWFINSIGL